MNSPCFHGAPGVPSMIQIPQGNIDTVNDIAVKTTWGDQRRAYMSGKGESIGLICKRGQMMIDEGNGEYVALIHSMNRDVREAARRLGYLNFYFSSLQVNQDSVAEEHFDCGGQGREQRQGEDEVQV